MVPQIFPVRGMVPSLYPWNKPLDLVVSDAFILATGTIKFIFLARVARHLFIFWVWICILNTARIAKAHERVRRQSNYFWRAVLGFAQTVAHQCESISERIVQDVIYIVWCIRWKFLHNIGNRGATAGNIPKCFLNRLTKFIDLIRINKKETRATIRIDNAPLIKRTRPSSFFHDYTIQVIKQRAGPANLLQLTRTKYIFLDMVGI